MPMRNSFVALSLIFILALAGCAVGLDYKRPSVPVPDRWRFEEREAQTIANQNWWEQFGDPVLYGLIRTAVRENTDIKIAAARVEEFLGRYGVAGAGLFPQVGVSATGLRKRVSGSTDPPVTYHNPYPDYQGFLAASWELDIWGKLRRASEAARADLLATEEGRRGVILTVVSAAAIGYIDLRDLDRQLEIAQRTVKSRGESLRLFRLRLDRGLISELELRQVESEYQSALATVPLTEKLIAQTENALRVLLGQNPGPIERGKALDDLVLPALPNGLPSELLERRPDIRQAEQNLIAANARIGVAKALYFPTISLTGLLGVESKDLSNLFQGPARIWSYALPITAPVFAGGAIRSQVKVAESVQQQALARYQQSIQVAFREVEDSIIDQRKSRERLEIHRKQVGTLQSYSKLARRRYENGYTSFLEVLDAERNLFAAELAYTETKAVLFRALVNLYKAMGGGWTTGGEKFAGQIPEDR
jgi:outer membrane protein, multidrug efflux system